MDDLNILSETANWHARDVRYYSGSWTAVLAEVPVFKLVPYTVGVYEPDNPHLLSVLRLPNSAAERPIPVGVVSKTYTLAQHREIADLCRQGLLKAGLDDSQMRFEIGLTELGEWMNFRIILDDAVSITDQFGEGIALRLECFNSVDGSSRLTIVFGWIRFICMNGLILGETLIEIRERHDRRLDIESIPERIAQSYEVAISSSNLLETWATQSVSQETIAHWVDSDLSEAWGKKAAARVYHICLSGNDVEFADPFAKGEATKKPIYFLDPVPGSPEFAQNKYDVFQALSFVASHRNQADQRIAWQTNIPQLLDCLDFVTH